MNMSRIGSILLLILGLLMLSTVTIFDPADITQNILLKIIPERKTPQEENVVVRLKFKEPVIPGQDKLDVKGVKDTAGNEMVPVKGHEIEAVDKSGAVLQDVRAGVKSDGTAVVDVVFSKDLSPNLNKSKFKVLCNGKPLDLSKAKVEYEGRGWVRIALPSGTMKDGDSCKVEVDKSLLDVAGLQLAGNTSKTATVRTWRAYPEISSVVQNLKVDPEGKTVDVVFSGMIDKDSAALSSCVKLWGGVNALKTKLLDDKKTIRATFEDPVIPHETLLAVQGVRDDEGHVIPKMGRLDVSSTDSQPPSVANVTVKTVPGTDNDEIIVTFTEPVLEDDATNLGNYTFECPVGTSVSVSGTAEYNSETHSTEITLTGTQLKTGDSFSLEVAKVRDLGGNVVKASGPITGKVVGDVEPPKIVRVVQNLYADTTGAVVDVEFDEAVDADLAAEVENYVVKGLRTIKVESQNDGKVMRVLFDKPVIPGETTITVSGIQDLAGNKMPVAKDVGMVPDETTPPTVIRRIAYAPSGMRNDYIAITFSEHVVPSDATNPANYHVESPKGFPLDLSSAELKYDDHKHQVKILFDGEPPVNLRRRDTFLVRISNVRDLGGNRIAKGTEVDGIVEGDSAPPAPVLAVLNTLADREGRVVDVTFDEPVDADSVADLANYEVRAPWKLEKAELLGDGKTVRLHLNQKITPIKSMKYTVLLCLLMIVVIIVALRMFADSPGVRIVITIVALLGVVGIILNATVSKSRGTQIRFFNIEDLAGNVLSEKNCPPVKKVHKRKLAIETAKLDLGSTVKPATLFVQFNRNIDLKALSIDDFKVEVSGGTLDLDGAKIVREMDKNAVEVLLPESVQKTAKPGEKFRLTIQKVTSVYGFAAELLRAEGTTAGDFDPPKIVKIVQKLDEDLSALSEYVEKERGIRGFSAGKWSVADVYFNEPIEFYSAEDTSNYLPKDMGTKLALLDDKDPKHVKLITTGTIIPGETTVMFRRIRDLAGNEIKLVTNQPIEPFETVPPKLVRSQVKAISGLRNDTIIVTFSERLVGGDAADLDNYTFECPVGNPINLSGASISYNAPTSTTTIKLAQTDPEINLKVGDTYKVVVSNVRDVCGNKLADNSTSEGVVAGDTSDPRILQITQNTQVDDYGTTVEVKFDEALDPVTGTDVDNFSTASGRHPVSAELLPAPEKPVDRETLNAIAEISKKETKEIVTAMTSLPRNAKYKSRIAGYPGADEAKEYIMDRFRALGLQPKAEPFDVVVPVEIGESKIELLSQDGKVEQSFRMFPLWPNEVKVPCLPKEGLAGHLIYAGKGLFKQYDGYETKDAVVLLDFSCGMNYVNARMLGAKCVIFRDDGHVSFTEAHDKFLSIPVDIPRFWVDKATGDKLMKLARRSPKVRLFARMKWEKRTAWNVMAEFEGADEYMPTVPGEEKKKWKDNLIVIGAYYDTMSVVPTIAPGADTTDSVAALLQIAKLLKNHPPKYSVLFLVTSGHFTGLEGINQFLYHHLRKSEYFEQRMAQNQLLNDRFKVFIGLDLSSHTDQVASFSEGVFYNWWWGTDNYKKNAIAPFAKKFAEYTKEIFPDEADGETARYLNGVTPSKRSWRHYMATAIGLDHEAVNWVGEYALSLVTAHDLRDLADTPLDNLSNVNFDNLDKQIKTIAALMLKATRDPEFFPDTKLKLRDQGHSLKGNAVWFDRNVNFFVPKAPIGDALVTYEQTSSIRSMAGVRTLLVTKSCEDNPHGGDDQRGFEVLAVTGDGERVLARVWDKDIKNVKEATAIVKTREGDFLYKLKDRDGNGIWQARINLGKHIYTNYSVMWWWIIAGAAAFIVFLIAFRANLSSGGRTVFLLIGFVILLSACGWTLFVDVLQVDNRIVKKIDENRSWEYRYISKLCLKGTDASGKEVVYDAVKDDHDGKAIDCNFGQFAGQFRFDIRRRRWATRIRAYKLDDNGRIVFAPDLGEEGDRTYPATAPYGWWETNMMTVLFPCRALNVFETVDSRYLTALDYATVLDGESDSTPQWYGIDQIYGQSRWEGKTTNAIVVYAKPGTRVKVLVSTGLLGVKYMLLNGPKDFFDHPVGPDNPDPSLRKVTPQIKRKALGKGYPIEQGIIVHPAFTGTRDMWVLDDVRMKELAQYNIHNQRIENLHHQARLALRDAAKYLAAKKYDRYMGATREAWGLEQRGYPDVKATGNDTIKGIVFYFMLLIPFSFFMERLLFGFSDIRKRTAGFAGIFVIVFMILKYVHPAFELSASPYVIFLAFVTLALAVIVLFFLMSKFNHEIRKMKQAASGIYEVDVGRLSAAFTAVSLGISNLRKRKLRTTLTATTLVLLTFTALSFTSVRTTLKYYQLPRENNPPYQGALVRDRSWKGLQPSVLRYLQSAFEGRATVIPRAWRMGRNRSEREYVKFENVDDMSKVSFANAIVGLTPREVEASHIDQFLIGTKSRWFKPGEENVCILPKELADIVGITPEDCGRAKISMLGSKFTVIGIIDSQRLNRWRDMDDEKLTPVDTVSENRRMNEIKTEDPDLQAAEPIEAFIHLEASNVLILPYDYVMDIGGTLHSVAITSFKNQDIKDEIERFMSRVALTVFVGIGDRVTVYSSIGATSISGLANLAIPVLIAALIVLNTMMGSVYERLREIGIYSSVGLAPTHIAFLFLAEAAVFATVGAVLGYLLGEVVTMILSHTGLLGGLNLNYSSLSAISSTLVVMATVFLSTLYPAKKAADMAVPDVTRKWKFPEPQGDKWVFDFPFTVSGAEIVGLYAYLARVFESYSEGSTGGFVAENVRGWMTPTGEDPAYHIGMRTWLAPYDLGISQDVTMDAIPTGEYHVYRVVVTLYRLSGDVASWRRINRGFLNVLRKRFLVWRTVGAAEKEYYHKRGQEIFKMQEPSEEETSAIS